MFTINNVKKSVEYVSCAHKNCVYVTTNVHRKRGCFSRGSRSGVTAGQLDSALVPLCPSHCASSLFTFSLFFNC